jgi:molybdenum cofactor synthesis domain-containing protein
MAQTPDLQELDRLRPPDEARRIIEEHLRVLPIERVALNDALGRVLAEDIVAPFDHPPFPASTMDGFAVLAADASPWREVIAVQPAGAMIEDEVHDGQAVRIMTGAPLPPGADAVVPIEDTEPTEDHVIIYREDVAPGTNIRPVGSDLRQGDTVLTAGTLLQPAHVGIVASMGLAEVPVRRRPGVSIIATGDEVIEPGTNARPGQIYDANRFSLTAAVRDAGGEVTWSGLAPDDREHLESLLRERMEVDDIILTSGGVSMGDLDLVKAILFDAPDVTVHFRRLFLKPGKPLNFATRGDTLIFGLPGNPVSSLVTFEVFLRPAMAILSGSATPDRPRVPVRLATAAAPSDRIEYQRGVVTVEADGTLSGASTGPQQSSRLASFVGANALLVIPPREEAYTPGEMVEAILLDAPLAATEG